MLMLAGMLLLIPGLITDVLAWSCWCPHCAAAFARWVLRAMFAGADVQVETHEWRSPGRAAHGPRASPAETSARASGGGAVIEGEWERVDEPKRSPKPTARRPTTAIDSSALHDACRREPALPAGRQS